MGFSSKKLTPLAQTEVDEVFEVVERITGVSKKMILSDTRKRFIVDARKIFVNVLRNHMNLTCFQIGGVVGKDHSSIVHYDKMHKVHMMEKEYRRMYSAVSGTYLIYKSVQDEERLRDQFTSLQERTRALLDALEGQQNKLGLTINDAVNINNKTINHGN